MFIDINGFSYQDYRFDFIQETQNVLIVSVSNSVTKIYEKKVSLDEVKHFIQERIKALVTSKLINEKVLSPEATVRTLIKDISNLTTKRLLSLRFKFEYPVTRKIEGQQLSQILEIEMAGYLDTVYTNYRN